MKIDMTGTAAIVCLPNEFSGAAPRELLVMVREAMQKTLFDLVLDCSQTQFMDSAGIGVLVAVCKDFRECKKTLTLRNLMADVKELFADTGIDKIFAIEIKNVVQVAEIDLFKASVDIKLDIKTEVRGDVCVLHLSGVMNHPVGSQFFKQQILLCLSDHKKVLLDFEDLTFFDSMSVSVLLKMNKLLKETGGQLRICGANFIVDDLFSMLNINQIISFFNTIDEALADWK